MICPHAWEQGEAGKAIDRGIEIVRNRVDQYGVSEPSIQKQGGRRIVVEPDVARQVRLGRREGGVLDRRELVLQLLALVAMEPPVSLGAEHLRDEKVKVIRALRPLVGPEDVVPPGATTSDDRRGARSSISSGRTMMRTSRPAWMANDFSTPANPSAMRSRFSSRFT